MTKRFIIAFLICIAQIGFAQLDPIRNKAKTTLSTTYDASATTIVLSSGGAAKFPDPSVDGAFNVVWYNSTDYPDAVSDPNYEIVRVTNDPGTDTWTITRAQEGTSATTKNTAGKTYTIFQAFTKKSYDDISAIASSAVTGAGTDLVKVAAALALNDTITQNLTVLGTLQKVLAPTILNPGRDRVTGSVYVSDSTEGTTPHGVLNVNRYGPVSYNALDDISALKAQAFVNSTMPTQPAMMTGIVGRVEVRPGGDYAPPQIIGGSFQADYKSSDTIANADAIVGSVIMNDGTATSRMSVATGVRIPAHAKVLGTVGDAFSAYLADQTIGDGENAAIRLETTGRISWNNDVNLQRASAGTLQLNGTLYTDETRTSGVAVIGSLGNPISNTQLSLIALDTNPFLWVARQTTSTLPQTTLYNFADSVYLYGTKRMTFGSPPVFSFSQTNDPDGGTSPVRVDRSLLLKPYLSPIDSVKVNGTAFEIYSGGNVFSTEDGPAGSGITSLNGLSAGTQTFATGTAGTDFAISSVTSTHTFNIPSSSASNRGLLTSTDWTTFNSKLGTALTSANIFVGNVSNVATGVAVTGDVSISNAGVTAIGPGVIVDADVNASAAIAGSKLQAAGVSNAGAITTGTQSIAGAKTLTSDLIVPAEVYGVGWDASNEVPTKNDVYDKIETISAGGEVNTMSSVGGGLAIFNAKFGVDFPMLSLNAPDFDVVANVIGVDDATWMKDADAFVSTASNGELLYQLDANTIDGIAGVTTTEVGYLAGVTSAIQTQLGTKAPLASPTFTGTVTIPTPFTLGAVSVTPTGTELNFVDGVTSAIQTQLDAKQATISFGAGVETWLGTPTSANFFSALTDESGAAGVVPRFSLTTPAQGDIIFYNGTSWVNLAPSTSGLFLQTQGAAANPIWAAPAGGGTVTHTGGALTLDLPLLGAGGDDIKTSTAANMRSVLSLVVGTDVQAWDADLDYLATFTPTANVKSILNAADYAAIKTLLALVIGTNVQAFDADLDTWSGVTPGTGVGTFLATPSSANLAAAVTGETGSGAAVFGTSPDFTTGATIGSVAIPTISSTNTLTNKRWTARVGSTTSSATPTINTDDVDIYKLTAQAVDITSMTTNLSGTPVDGDILEIQITGTAARAITWGASFVSSTVTLPTTTVTTATLSVVLQYFVTSSYGANKWVCVNSF